MRIALLVMLLCAGCGGKDRSSAVGEPGEPATAGVSPSHAWSLMLGGEERDEILALAVDPDGHLLAAGTTSNPGLDLAGSPLEFEGETAGLLLKLDPAGVLLWARAIGDGNQVYLSDLAVDGSGDFVVTGELHGDVLDLGSESLENAGGTCHVRYPCPDGFVARFDPDGEPAWSVRLGGAGEDPAPLLALDGDDVLVAGRVGPEGFKLGGWMLQSDDGEHESDIYVARFTRKGEHVWSRSYGGPGPEAILDLAVTSAGSIYLTGLFHGADLELGGIHLEGRGESDAFIAKLDAEGEPLWVRAYGSEGHEEGKRLVALEDGGAILALGFSGAELEVGDMRFENRSTADEMPEWMDVEYPVHGSDVLVVRFDSQGEVLWTAHLGGDEDDVVEDMALAGSGRVVMVGTFESSVLDLGAEPLEGIGKHDAYVFMFHTEGAPLWSTRMGGAETDVAAAATSTGDRLYVGGFSYTDGLNLGGELLAHRGDGDLFVLAVDL